MKIVKNNVFTGENGYLMTNLLKNGVFSDINDTIIHFSGPSCIDEFTKETITRMINDVKSLLMLPHKNFIFASSMGVEISSNIERQQMYNNAKKKCEKLIIGSGKKYAILRIPRVYSKDRKKGLMKQLRENKVPEADFNKMIEYLSIEEFVKQTKKIKLECNIIHYTDLSVESIYTIKNLYT